jgi:hypothetical protein
MRVLLVDTGAKRASVIEASLRQLDAVEIVRVAEAPSLGEAAAAWSPRGGGAVPPVSAGRERAARREGLDRGSQLIDKAKTRLMKARELSEPDAYRMLRRRAMDGGRRIAEIAAAILDR